LICVFSLNTSTISPSSSCDSGLIVALFRSNWIFSRITILSAVTSTRLGFGGGGGSSFGGGGGAGGSPTIASDDVSEKAMTPPQALSANASNDSASAATKSAVRLPVAMAP
jgi:hypothetical protein